MKDLLIKLFQRVYVEDNDSSVNKSRGHILNAEVAVYGYTLSAELIRATSKLDEVNFLEVRRDLLESLSIISGTHVNHNTLFVDFPYSIPEADWNIYITALWYVRNQMLEGEDHNYRILSCGHIISDTPFEGLEAEFGACPICQFQVEELKDTAGAKYEFKSITPLKTLYLADDEFIADKATSLLSKSSSLSADERKFVLEAVKEFKLQIPSSIYRENLPLAYTVAEGDMNKIKHLFNGATDVMRLAVFLSDADGDLSLSRNTKFRITRSASKKLLATLNDMKNLPEDMLRHREKWKRLLHALHATTAVNKRRFPNVAAAEIVRNNGTGYETFNAKSERLTRARLINSADGLAQHLRGRPGEFVRKLDFMLLHADPDRKQEILNILVEVVDQIETGTIFNLIKHLKSRCQPGNTRIFIPKGVVTKIQTRIDEREPLDLMTVEAAVSIFEKELIKRYSLLPEIGKVFIDPIMFKQVVPFNRRGDSSTTLPISKGSRFPLGDAPVIRLFTWWKGSFDVDLSADFL